jgi:hypothetical protein
MASHIDAQKEANGILENVEKVEKQSLQTQKPEETVEKKVIQLTDSSSESDETTTSYQLIKTGLKIVGIMGTIAGAVLAVRYLPSFTFSNNNITLSNSNSLVTSFNEFDKNPNLHDVILEIKPVTSYWSTHNASHLHVDELLSAEIKQPKTDWSEPTATHLQVDKLPTAEINQQPEHGKNENFVIEALRKKCNLYQYGSSLLKYDYKLMKKALLCEPSFYSTLAPYLANKKEANLINEVIEEKPSLINSIDLKNPHYEHFVSTALGQDLNIYPPFPWRESTRAFKLEAAKTQRHIFRYFPEKYRADAEIALVAIRKNINDYNYIAPSLARNRSFQRQVKCLKEEMGKSDTKDRRDDPPWIISFLYSLYTVFNSLRR